MNLNTKKIWIIITSLLILNLSIAIFLAYKVYSLERHNTDESVIQNVEKNDTIPEKSEELTEHFLDENENFSSKNETLKEYVSDDDYEVSNQDYSEKDKIVIDELESIEKTTEKVLNEGSTSYSEKAKGIFISLVDFIFYDGTIKGVTFDELSNSGKEKVLKIVSSIDKKIENKIPGYKESISSKTSIAFKKASEIIQASAQNINEFSKEKLGEENYNSILSAKDELVDYTKQAFTIVKSFSSSTFTKIKDKLSSWYENFKKD